jgi:hypothetical protein
VLDPNAGPSPDPTRISQVHHHHESWPNGKVRAEWSTGRANDGEILLEGPEAFNFPDGRLQWSAHFHLGRKTGAETLFREDGSKIWQKDWEGNQWTWRAFGASGQQTAISHWKGKTLLDASVAEQR